jgi:hypothetical protein
MIMFHFLFIMLYPLIIGHVYVLQYCLNKDQFSSCLHHTFDYALFYMFYQLSNDV